MARDHVHIYTDGSSRGNPGPGGYGIVMEWVGTDYKKEFSKGFKTTTNNRMELMAVVDAMKKITRDVAVTVYTDSTYVSNAINKGWLNKWHKQGYTKCKNPDLWMMMFPLQQRIKAQFVWIKGHNNHPQNERCDTLAVNAATGDKLSVDGGYKAK